MFQEMADFRRFLGENPYRATTEEYYRWKLSENPFCRGSIYLERRHGKIVGSTTLTPKRIAFLGDVCIAAEISDTFTLPEYQRQGIFSKGVRECTGFGLLRGIKIIYGTPNEQSLLGYEKKLGYPCCL